MGNGFKRTSGAYPQGKSQKPTVGALDSHALTSALQGGSSASKGSEAACFSELCSLLTTSKKKIDPHIYSLKMLKTCFALTEGQTSSGCFLRWTKAAMMQNGRFLILPITSPKTGSAYSLWDILEDEVPAKYFLSLEQMQRILFFKCQQSGRK